MVEVLSHFLGFFIGFTLTLGIIGSILYYIKPDSRKSTYFIWDLFGSSFCVGKGGSDQFPYYELYHWVYFGASSKIMALHGSL